MDKILHLSICLKNLSPKPTPLCAPSIKPGISAKTISLLFIITHLNLDL